jgi:hypothetical protein
MAVGMISGPEMLIDLIRLELPRLISTLARGTSNSPARNLINSLLARPSTGRDLSLMRNASPWMPTNSVWLAPGWTRTRIRRESPDRRQAGLSMALIWSYINCRATSKIGSMISMIVRFKKMNTAIGDKSIPPRDGIRRRAGAMTGSDRE